MERQPALARDVRELTLDPARMTESLDSQPDDLWFVRAHEWHGRIAASMLEAFDAISDELMHGMPSDGQATKESREKEASQGQEQSA